MFLGTGNDLKMNLGVMGGGAGIPYSDVLVNTYGASEVWPLVDIVSGTTITAKVQAARNGTLQGWDLQNTAGPVPGTLMPYSDGVNDYGNILTASLQSLFNGNVGSLFMFLKAEAWNTFAYALRMEVNNSNYIRIWKDSVGSSMWLRRRGSGVSIEKDLTPSVLQTTSLFSLGMSWNTGSDEQKAYINGNKIGATQTGLGVLSGTLAISLIGAADTVPSNVWNGNFAYLAVKFGSVWSDADFAAMHAAAATSGGDPP